MGVTWGDMDYGEISPASDLWKLHQCGASRSQRIFVAMVSGQGVVFFEKKTKELCEPQDLLVLNVENGEMICKNC